MGVGLVRPFPDCNRNRIESKGTIIIVNAIQGKMLIRNFGSAFLVRGSGRIPSGQN
jgi:hypothetical protein